MKYTPAIIKYQYLKIIKIGFFEIIAPGSALNHFNQVQRTTAAIHHGI